ncbi:MAG TPA: hypothetical protein VK066_16750 [Chloroflexota bacterium]|nr:hypothetical protein [Chloroflexota bacterium]
MLQDDRAANQPSESQEEPGASAIERVQRELAETRSALQGETTQISQLQQTLEEALRVARGVRLEALNELDRLAGELMDAARRDAAAIRAQAEDEAQAIRTRGEEDVRELRARAEEELRAYRQQAEEELRAQREAAEAAAAAQRADLDRRVRAAQAELETIQNAWASAAQALATARQNLMAGLSQASTLAEPGSAAPPAAASESPPAAPEPSASAEASTPPSDWSASLRPSATSVPSWGTSTIATVSPSAPEPPTWATPAPEPVAPSPTGETVPEGAEPLDITRFNLAPTPLVEPAAEAGATIEPRQDSTEELGPAPVTAPPAGEPEAAELFEGPSGSPLEQAGQQLKSGDVAGALDTYRSIVDRSPEDVESVISRLTVMLHDGAYRTQHEEVRLLLVDAYMVQGDYDRAMSLLHEPAS